MADDLDLFGKLESYLGSTKERANANISYTRSVD
jgi:hypothetical protein